MKTKLLIPDNIHVGFQNRSDTYTGKLAYVTFKSGDKLRQEKSWTGWCSQKIPKVIYDNEPTSGFVLNKKVGEYGGWNPRKAWVRVYDPRDFEFEISIANLLFILEHCSIIKGKGLDGDFVYSWDGGQVGGNYRLVLLPMVAPEYATSREHSRLVSASLTEKDMEEGCLYKTKEGEEVLYLGKQTFYYMHSAFDYSTWRQRPAKQHYTRKHIFVPTGPLRNRSYYPFKGERIPYWVQPGFNKLAERLTEEPAEEFAAEFEKFKNSVHGKKPVKTTTNQD